MLLSSVNLRKLADYLLLNAYSLNDVGLLNGKAGIALTLFELSRYLKDSCLEEHAFEILQASLVSRADDSFARGKAGAGYGLWYLLQHRFVEGEYMELFGEQHRTIIQGILKTGFKGEEKECARLFYFLNEVGVESMGREQREAAGKLAGHLERYYKAVLQNGLNEYGRFLSVSANVMPVVIRSPEEWKELRQLLTEAVRRCRTDGWISDNPWYSEELQKLGRRYGCPDLVDGGGKDLEVMVKNITPQVMTVKQLTDAMLCILASGQAEAEEKLRQLLEESPELTEAVLSKRLGHPAFWLGVEQGIGRLLLAVTGMQEIAARSRLAELFRLTF